MSDPAETAREATVRESGFKVENPADTKLYPTAGLGVHKPAVDPFALPIIEVTHLTTMPTLKTWLGERTGQTLRPEHQPIIDALKRGRANGARITLNVNTDGFYDRAFSSSNGNSTRLDDLLALLDAGLSWGECLLTTKLVCGQSGNCGAPGPCGVCQDIQRGCYADKEFVKPEKVRNRLPAGDPLDDEINALLDGNRFILLEDRVMNLENRSSASIEAIKDMCQIMGKGVVYVLEMLGVFRLREAESHEALKRADLGGI